MSPQDRKIRKIYMHLYVPGYGRSGRHNFYRLEGSWWAPGPRWTHIIIRQLCCCVTRGNKSPKLLFISYSDNQWHHSEHQQGLGIWNQQHCQVPYNGEEHGGSHVYIIDCGQGVATEWWTSAKAPPSRKWKLCQYIKQGTGYGQRQKETERSLDARPCMGGYYGKALQWFRGVTQGDPLSLDILNLVMDAVVRNWV